MCIGFPLYTRSKTLNPTHHMSLGLSWKILQKKHYARDSIDRARPKCTLNSTIARFQLYIKDTTLSKSKQN